MDGTPKFAPNIIDSEDFSSKYAEEKKVRKMHDLEGDAMKDGPEEANDIAVDNNEENSSLPHDSEEQTTEETTTPIDFDEKILAAKNRIAELEKQDKDISTGKEGFRIKVKGEMSSIEAEILEKENEIRNLEKEKNIIPKRQKIAELKGEIDALEKTYKERITGVKGFRDADEKEDSIEKDIREREEQIKILETDIREFDLGNKKTEPKNDDGTHKKEGVGNAEDFEYAGTNEGFGNDIIEDIKIKDVKPGGNGRTKFRDVMGEEVKKIRSGTKEERKQKLAEFKEKLTAQKKAISEIQKQLFAGVEKNPDASVDQYLESVKDLIEQNGLSEDQKKAFKDGIENYKKTHQAIWDNTKDCIDAETGKIDGPKLYEKLFNHKPSGRVEVILRPAMIYLRAENLDDYAIAYNHGAVDQVTDEMREKANKSAGCMLNNFKIAGLENAIALEKATDGKFELPHNEKTLQHEQQHVFNRIIQHGYDAEGEKTAKEMESIDKKYKKNPTNDNKDIKEKNLAIKNINIENSAKDEIAAYFKQGSSPEYVREVLLKPDTIYKYGFDYKGGDKNKSEFSQEYIDLVDNGIAAYSNFLKAGYSVEDAQGLLFVEPLSKWAKVVERIVGEPKEEIKDNIIEDKDTIDRATKIAELREEIEKSRKEFLEVDYKKNTAFKRLGKFFGNLGKYSEERTLENDQDIAWYRAQYDNNLFDLQELLIEDAKEKKSSDKELSDIMIEFEKERNITMEKEHDQVKLEQQAGTFPGWVGKNMVEIGTWYNKLPTKYKLAIGGSFLVAGLATGGVGALASVALSSGGAGALAGGAGVFAKVALGRRLFSGLTTGVGTRLGLEAKWQEKAQEKAQKEQEEFLKSLEGLSEEKKYEELAKNIKNISIKDEKNAINQIKNQDLMQIGAGAMVGGFLASGMAGNLMRRGLSWGGKEIHALWEHFKDAPVAAPIMESVAIEDLTIEKGSNFSATLLDEFNDPDSDFYKLRPDLKGHNPQELIDKILADFKATHPEMNGHNPDYVLANAKIHFDPQTLHADMDEGKYGWYDNVDAPPDEEVVDAPDVSDAPDVPQEIPEPPQEVAIDTSDAAQEIPPPPPPEVADFADAPYEEVENGQDYQPEIIVEQPPYVPSPEIRGPIFISGHINLERLGVINPHDALREVRGPIFDHDPAKFRHLRHVNVLNHDGVLDRGALREAGIHQKSHRMILDLASSRQHPEIRPRGGEDFERWTRRIVGVAERNHGGGAHRR